MTTQDRYRNDPKFHNLVDHLELLVSQGEFTHSELRAAVILAAAHYKMRGTDVEWFIDRYGVKRSIREDVRNVKKLR